MGKRRQLLAAGTLGVSEWVERPGTPLSDPQHHRRWARHTPIDLPFCRALIRAPVKCLHGSGNTGGQQQMAISSFTTNEIRHEKCCVNFKDLIITVSNFFLGCLELHSLIRGHSLRRFGITFNHKGGLWSPWIGHTQYLKYSYNLRLIIV